MTQMIYKGNKGNINPKMVVMARESRGFTRSGLACKMKMQTWQLKLIEEAKERIWIDRKIIDRLSIFLQYPDNFFAQSGFQDPFRIAKHPHEPHCQGLEGDCPNKVIYVCDRCDGAFCSAHIHTTLKGEHICPYCRRN